MRRNWTEQEEKYMEKKYTSQPVETTAKKLDRTIVSVKRKAAKMGLNHYADELNARTLANCFNVDVAVVIKWIDKFDLPCKKVVCKNQTRYLIQMDEFWKWAEKNKGIINWSKYEEMSLCPEPMWLKQAIDEYGTPNSRKRFTEQEIIIVKNLLHRGLQYREIAEEIGRSYYSVSHLCRNIYKVG